MNNLLKLLIAVLLVAPGWAAPPRMPYAEAGLDEKQAAAHLLSRFSFGPRPGEVDAVAQEGVVKWFSEQLRGNLPDTELSGRLSPYRSLGMTDEEIASNYMDAGTLRKMANVDKSDKKSADGRMEMREYAEKNGIRTVRELAGELFGQKVVRSVYAKNQLEEVMTDFWFNHFNVSLTNNQCRAHVLSYERDAIRPHALGHFRQLLESTAKHPAMLFYLNNAQSMAAGKGMGMGNGKKPRGINENYARELMELHTLGVDGGYTQKDVTEVARALTGWTTFPKGPRAERFRQQLEKARENGMAVVEEGGFVFVPSMHDSGTKQILGRSFPAGRGMQEGMEILDMLCNNPATANRVARKLAARFVSDTPSKELVAKLAQRYRNTSGDIRQMLVCIVESPEFWSAQSRRAKIKSPFEYVVSSIRGLGAEVSSPRRDLYTWLEKMGQPVYSYQAPTGFPDKAETWINGGTVVNRINFAFALVSNRIGGVHWQPPARANNNELARQLLTGRDWQATLKQANSTLNNPKFFESIKDSEGRSATANLARETKLVGILVSSPEFQHR